MAQWRANDLFDITYMQQMTSSICSATTTPNSGAMSVTTSRSSDKTKVPQKTLIDTRDNNSYRVRKLADGNCWMVDDLRIYNRTINASQSDFPSGTFTIPRSDTNPVTRGTNDWLKQGVYDGYLAANNHILYSWGTATKLSSSGAVGSVAPYSICSKNWGLPNHTGNKSYASILSLYSISNIGNTTYNLDLQFYGEHAWWIDNNKGWYASWWDNSVASVNTDAGNMTATTYSNIQASKIDAMVARFMVRCVAR